MALIPYGSRIPLAVLDGPHLGVGHIIVYVFDINPITARYAKQGLAAQHSNGELGVTSITMGNPELEEALPGAVDPHCSTTRYVAYRFKLPYLLAESPCERSIGR